MSETGWTDCVGWIVVLAVRLVFDSFGACYGRCLLSNKPILMLRQWKHGFAVELHTDEMTRSTTLKATQCPTEKI